MWIKQKSPANVKYWKGNTQLERLSAKDPSIQCFPQKVIDTVGSVDEVNEHCVIFSAYGYSGRDWNTNIEAGREILDNIMVAFPEAFDQHHRVLHDINYVVKKVPGFMADVQLIKYVVFILRYYAKFFILI